MRATGSLGGCLHLLGGLLLNLRHYRSDCDVGLLHKGVEDYLRLGFSQGQGECHATTASVLRAPAAVVR